MTTDLGPVSRAREADLREWVRKHGIVVWIEGPLFTDGLALVMLLSEPEPERMRRRLRYMKEAIPMRHLRNALPIVAAALGRKLGVTVAVGPALHERRSRRAGDADSVAGMAVGTSRPRQRWTTMRAIGRRMLHTATSSPHAHHHPG